MVDVDFGGQSLKETRKYFQAEVESMWSTEDVSFQIWHTVEMKGLGVDLKNVLNTLGAALVEFFGDDRPAAVAEYKFNKKYKGLIIFVEFSDKGTSDCFVALGPYEVEEVGITKKEMNKIIEAYEW